MKAGKAALEMALQIMSKKNEKEHILSEIM